MYNLNIYLVLQLIQNKCKIIPHIFKVHILKSKFH